MGNAIREKVKGEVLRKAGEADFERLN